MVHHSVVWWICTNDPAQHATAHGYESVRALWRTYNAMLTVARARDDEQPFFSAEPRNGDRDQISPAHRVAAPGSQIVCLTCSAVLRSRPTRLVVKDTVPNQE